MDDETIDRIREMRSAGSTLKTISEEVGLAESTVYNYIMKDSDSIRYHKCIRCSKPFLSVGGGRCYSCCQEDVKLNKQKLKNG